MKKLVVFYSLEGNTRLVAEAIAAAAGADLLELKPRKALKAGGLLKFFWGGRQVITRSKPLLLPLTRQPEDYDVIFVGTPVWVGTFTPALATLFSQVRLQGKKIALFCCHAGGKGKVFDNMKRALAGNEILGEVDFQEPLKQDPEQEQERARAWAAEIVAGM